MKQNENFIDGLQKQCSIKNSIVTIGDWKDNFNHDRSNNKTVNVDFVE